MDTRATTAFPVRSLRGPAAALLDEVAADPQRRLLVGVTGPAGTGKSALLGELASVYRAAGFETRHGPTPDLASRDATAYTAVLVDDAHDLDDVTLGRLRELAQTGESHLVVAHRPWPRSSALRALLATLDLHRPPVALGPMARDDIAVVAAHRRGQPVPGAVVDALARVTAGMPWLVQRVVTTWPRDGVQVAPPAVLAQLGRELEHLDDRLRELLLDLAVGFDLSGDTPPPALERDLDGVEDLVAHGEAAGLLTSAGAIVPLVGEALLAATPAHRVRARQRALLAAVDTLGRPLDDVARQLARTGLADPRVAAALTGQADAALARDPVAARALYAQAVAAGADAGALAARRAQAAALSGDLDEAGRIVDDLLTQPGPPDLGRAVDVAAEVWSRRGMLARSAQVYRWLGAGRVGASAPLAVVALLGAGDREGAEEMLDAAPAAAPPTVLAAVPGLMSEGLRATLDGSATAAMASLVRASDMLTASGCAIPLPISPAALGALVALHVGELSVAESVVEGALAGGQGSAAARPGLLLFRAWTAMLRDRPDLAQSALAEAAAGGHPASPREELFLRALEVGLARRTDDAPALVQAWGRARETILHFPVDLFTLLPLGELLIAAARLRDTARVEGHVAEAWALLSRLGDPPLWAVPLHWAHVHAAILAERPADLGPHAAALVRAAGKSHYAAVLASAGRAWVSVLAGNVDVATVENAARGLASVGLTWDGSRLAGHAAARTEERKDMARLLARARDLHPGTKPGLPQEPAPAASRPLVDDSGLSPREREIAGLVLAGKTYREIGDTIYISPRTVEHHVARIRRRLGAASRSELLARLRIALGEEWSA
ncbi:helix-turn-helix transcriptional regulator [Georgenia thermotolerans]|nr:helix-turn-helix transcriptional regulator [Georgenia thermotolerans]